MHNIDWILQSDPRKWHTYIDVHIKIWNGSYELHYCFADGVVVISEVPGSIPERGKKRSPSSDGPKPHIFTASFFSVVGIV